MALDAFASGPVDDARLSPAQRRSSSSRPRRLPSASTERLRPLRLTERCVNKRGRARVVRFRASDPRAGCSASRSARPDRCCAGHESDGTLCNWMPSLESRAERLPSARLRLPRLRVIRRSSGRFSARSARFGFRGRGNEIAQARGREDRVRRRLDWSERCPCCGHGGNAARLAVVSLSAADSTLCSSRLDGSVTVPKLTVPVLFMVAEERQRFRRRCEEAVLRGRSRSTSDS